MMVNNVYDSQIIWSCLNGKVCLIIEAQRTDIWVYVIDVKCLFIGREGSGLSRRRRCMEARMDGGDRGGGWRRGLRTKDCEADGGSCRSKIAIGIKIKILIRIRDCDQD